MTDVRPHAEPRARLRCPPGSRGVGRCGQSSTLGILSGLVLAAVTTVASISVAPAPAVSRTSSPQRVSAATFPVKLDAIEAKVTAVQREASPGLPVGAARCERLTRAPVGVSVLRCTVPVADATVPYRARLTMSKTGAATFSVAATRVPIDTRVLAGFVRDVLEPEARAEAAIDCGPRRVVVVDPGDVVSCTARLAGERQRFRFTVTDLQGSVEMDV